MCTRVDAETGYTVEVVYGGSEDNEEGDDDEDEGTQGQRRPVTISIGNLLGEFNKKAYTPQPDLDRLI